MLSQRLESLQDEVVLLSDRLAALESNKATDIDTLRDDIAKECKAVLQSETDRAKRQNNLVIFGLTESTLAESEDRINDDKNRIQNIFVDELDLPNVTIAKTIRLFPKVRNPNNSKPAPVKVVLSNNFDRNSVLKNAKKLASPKVPQNRVYIAPCLSKEEREENEKLRAELQTKRNASLAAGENCKWIIKGKKNHQDP